MQNNGENQVYAGFFVRLAAYVMDWIVVSLALLVVKIPFWGIALYHPDHFLIKDFIFEYSIKDIVVYGLGAAYFILLTYFTGATLGKRMLCLRVVSSEEGKLTLFQVVYRETVGRFLSQLIVCVGYIAVGLDKEKRGFHDSLADTRVVYHHVKEVRREIPITYRNIDEPIYNGMQNGSVNVDSDGPVSDVMHKMPVSQDATELSKTGQPAIMEDTAAVETNTGQPVTMENGATQETE